MNSYQTHGNTQNEDAIIDVEIERDEHPVMTHHRIESLKREKAELSSEMKQMRSLRERSWANADLSTFYGERLTTLARRRNEILAELWDLTGEEEYRPPAKPANDVQLWKQNPVMAALQYTVEEEKADVKTIATKLSELKAERASLLPVEGERRKQLDSIIAKVEEEHKIHSAKRDNGYKRIDLRIPLSWRTQRKHMPSLAIFSPSKPEMKIQLRNIDLSVLRAVVGGLSAVIVVLGIVALFTDPVTVSLIFFLVAALVPAVAYAIYKMYMYFNAGVIPKTLPKHLTKYYTHDIRTYLDSSRRRSSIVCKFPAGCIPDDARQEILKAQQTFGKRNVFIVAEAKWAEQSSPPNFDPLVIAVQKDVTYLVTSFDLTPLETAVLEEFTF